MAVVDSKKFTKTGSQLVTWTLTRKFASQLKGQYIIYGSINVLICTSLRLIGKSGYQTVTQFTMDK